MEEPQRTQRVRTRDPRELQQIAAECLPVLLRAARAAGLDLQRAEDATQSAFLTFLEKADQFAGRAQVRTWLFGILYKKIAEAQRAAAHDPSPDDIDQVVADRFGPLGAWVRPPLPADAGVEREEVRRWIEECLGRLPEAQRIAFVLREVECLPTAEICKILQVTGNNLGVMLYRGRNRLRECLEAMGGRGDAAV
ncbi:MAG: sigma-70 family RNA polymerase sigma factor [Candidatus Latescibacterota bacterium]